MSSYVSDIRGTRVMTGLCPALYDEVLITYPDANTEVYSFFYESNPAGVVTLVYSGDNLVSATRTA